MEEFLTNSSPPKLNHFSNFSDPDSNVSWRQPRHHSNSYSGNLSYERSRKAQSETDQLRERVRTWEKGLGKIYQVIHVICYPPSAKGEELVSGGGGGHRNKTLCKDMAVRRGGVGRL